VAKIVVLAGGGIKSAVAAAAAASTGEHELVLVHVDHGQASASAERSAVESLARSCQPSRLVRLDLPHFAELPRQLSMTAGIVRSPEQNRGMVTTTGTPGALRGLMPMLLTMGLQCGQRVGATSVVTGLSRHGDASRVGMGGLEDRPDAMREFLHAFGIMMECILPTSSKVSVEAPLVDLTPVEILRLAHRFDVPLESTWTCEESGPSPCARCKPCEARCRAFDQVGRPDPLLAPAQA